MASERAKSSLPPGFNMPAAAPAQRLGRLGWSKCQKGVAAALAIQKLHYSPSCCCHALAAAACHLASTAGTLAATPAQQLEQYSRNRDGHYVKLRQQ
jgi:hypothetical protein